MKTSSIIGSITAKAAALLVAFGCTLGAWAADPVTIQNERGQDISVYEVASGFYQSAATYPADGYITSKAGLEYFRDLINGKKSVTDDYMSKGFYSSSGYHGAFYSNNMFSGKTIHLLADIDLENSPWEPIGYVHLYSSDKDTYYVTTTEAGTEVSAKTYFYGSFDGHGHVISNVRIVRMLNNQSRPDKYWKNFGTYGLFGYVSSSNPVFQNITIRNFTAICGENTLGDNEYAGDYLGAFIGDSGSNLVTFRNCHVVGEVNISSSYIAGGIVGIGQVNVAECSVEATSGTGVSASTWAGGLVGAERAGNALNVSGNTVSGIAISSNPRTGSLVGAMALGVAGACSVTGNDVVDCLVNGEEATLENLFGPTTATTEMTYANNTVRSSVIVETGDLTPSAPVTEATTDVTYTVPVTVKDRGGNTISESVAQEVAVSVSNDDVADTKLTSVKLDEVVTKAIAAVGEDATSVSAVEILVKATSETTGESSITYEVHPEAVVTVSKSGETPTTTEVAIANDDLAEGETFTFNLDVTDLGVGVGGTVSVTHTSEGYPTETTLATVQAGDGNAKFVSVTTDHFSTWTLEGVTVEPETVAIVFAANGSQIGQYTSVTNAIAADTTVNGCTVLVLDGTHNAGSSTITINKSITLTGQSKAGTVLNFTATGHDAFNVCSGSVTIKDLTIYQEDTKTDITTHIRISAASASEVYSNITIQNVKFTGAMHSLAVYAENLTVDSCEFINQPSAPVLLYCSRGTTVFSNNTITQGNVSSKGGMIYSTSPYSGVKSSGTLRICGNVATGGRALYFWENQTNIENLTLEIINNVVTEYNNKGVVFYSGDDLSKYFSVITITNNVFSSTFKRPAVQREDSNQGNRTINASYNYWGVSDPDFSAPIPGGSKYYVSGDNITYEPYYITYNSTTGELSDLRPLPKVAKIVRGGADFAQYETLQDALTAAQGGDTIELLSDISWSGTGQYAAYNQLAAAGNVTIDGKGYTLSAPTTGGPTDSAIMLGDSSSSGSSSVYTITNMTFSGFTTISHSVLRVQGVTANIVDCTFTGNGSTGAEWGVVTVNNGADVTVKDCVFRGNTGTKCVDVGFNVATGSSLAVDNCLFENNNLTGHGVIYVAGGIDTATIRDSSFSGNTVLSPEPDPNDAKPNAAVVYCSGVTDITGCLFTNNTVKAYGKEGIIVLGSSADGAAITGNAFVDNTLSTERNPAHYATLYVSKTCNLSGNYWGDGEAPAQQDTQDIYNSGTATLTVDTYATDYTAVGNGVTVTLYIPPVAAVITDNGATTNTYDSFAGAISAARANGGTVALLADIEVAGGTSTGYDMSDITLDGHGYTISCASGVLFSGTNVVVRNLNVEMGASGNHIMTVTSGTFTGCEFVGASGVKAANYSDDKTGVAKTLTFSYCTFRDFTTDNAVLNDDESDSNSRLIVDHCTFSNTVRVAILQRADTFTNNTITDFAKFTANNTGVVITGNTFDKGTRNGVMKMYQKPATISGNDFSAAGVFENNNTATMTADDPLNLYDNIWGDYDKSTLPVGIIAELPSYVAQIIRNNAVFAQYETLAAAITAAQDGDTIELIADVTGENVTVTESVTITGASDAEGNPAITLENTQLTLSGATVELAVTNLAFTGASYINASNGKALTVDHVTATVDPAKITGRSAFIVVSTSEYQTGLDLTITHSTIVNTFGTDSFGAAVFGWAFLNSATICDNVLGSDGYRFRFIAVKLMNAVDGAVYTIERNTVYGTNANYPFFAFDLYQNNSRNNSYTALSKENVFDVTATGSNDIYAFDIERNGNASATIKVLDSGSTLNGDPVSIGDFMNEIPEAQFVGYYGAGVVYDESGKMTAGTFNRELSDAELEEFVAEGLRSFAVGDGTYTLDVPVAQIGTTYYATFAEAIAAAEDYYAANGSYPTITVLDATAEQGNADWKIADGYLVKKVYVAQIVGGAKYEALAPALAAVQNGETLQLLSDIQLSGADAIEINKVGTYTIDGNGFSITPAADSAYIYQRFKFGESGQAYDSTRNYIVTNLTITGFSDSTYFIRSEGCRVTFADCYITNNTFAGQANSRVMLSSHADITIDGCIVSGNTSASHTVDFGSNAGSPNTMLVNNCLFEGNIAGDTAVVFVTQFNSATFANSTFEGNTVNSSNNGAVVYFYDGVGDDCTGCLFKDNVVNYTTTSGYENRVRVAGAIFTWAQGESAGTISGNAFVNNSVVKQNANFLTCYAKAIYSGGYYNPQDLAGNYFGGSAPVIGQADKTTANNDIYAEYASKEVTASTYAMSYTLNDDDYGVTVVVPVAQIVRADAVVGAYADLQSAFNAAQSGDTIELMSDIEIDSSVKFYTAGTFTIDGMGYTLSKADGAAFGAYGAIELGAEGSDASTIPQKSYTITNVTFTGFASEIIRAESCTITLADCTFSENNISIDAGRDKQMLRFATTALTVRDCTFSGNSTGRGLYIDEQTAAAATINVTGNLFTGNTIYGNAIVLVSTAASASDAVVGNTFSSNTLESTDNIAALYISAPVEDVSGNLFSGNTITTAAGKKEGVIVLGSGSTGTVINENAFVGNELGTVNHYATIYVGANCNLSGNYWGDGADAEIADTKDVYKTGSQTIADTGWGVAYAVNENGRGVTVTVPTFYTATFVGGTVDGSVTVTLPDSLKFWNSGSATELPVATSDWENHTFAGWSLSGTVVAAIPAGTAENITLVATWIGAQTIQIDGDGNNETPLNDIKVTDAWLEENNLKDKDAGAIKAALETTEENGNKAWENYVLGLNANAGVSADAAQGSTTVMPVSSTIAAPAVDTGFTVTYQIDEVDASGATKEGGEGQAQATPDLAIDLSTVESNAYFKVTATIKSGGDTVSTVTSTNTIGVLVVSNGANTVAIAVPWASYDGTGAISVSNLVRTTNLTPGDTLQAYDSKSKKYKAWTLTAGKTWEPATVAGGSGATAADAYTVARGSAVWLTRDDPTQPIYLVGGAAEASGKVETKLEAAPSETKSSWNLVGSPTVEPVDVSTILEGKDGDKVVVPTAGAPKNYEYVEGKGWGYWTTETVTLKNGRKAVKSVFRTDDTYVPAGTGFWYLNSSTGSDSKIEW